MPSCGLLRKGRLGPKIIFGTVVVALVIVLLFLLAGRWNWFEGWAFIGIGTLGQGISALCVRFKNPGLLSKRGEMGKGTKAWDKFVLGAFGVAYLAILTVGALDARHEWSVMAGWLWGVGVVLYLFFVIVVTWAMCVNPFFEKTVRIQSERGHRVIDSGPYRVIRHPGYLGSSVGFTLGTPLVLASWWALVPAFAGVVCLVIRTMLEDRALRRELPGYEAYAQRVRYRLVPGIW